MEPECLIQTLTYVYISKDKTIISNHNSEEFTPYVVNDGCKHTDPEIINKIRNDRTQSFGTYNNTYGFQHFCDCTIVDAEDLRVKTLTIVLGKKSAFTTSRANDTLYVTKNDTTWQPLLPLYSKIIMANRDSTLVSRVMERYHITLDDTAGDEDDEFFEEVKTTTKPKDKSTKGLKDFFANVAATAAANLKNSGEKRDDVKAPPPEPAETEKPKEEKPGVSWADQMDKEDAPKRPKGEPPITNLTPEEEQEFQMIVERNEALIRGETNAPPVKPIEDETLQDDSIFETESNDSEEYEQNVFVIKPKNHYQMELEIADYLPTRIAVGTFIRFEHSYPIEAILSAFVSSRTHDNTEYKVKVRPTSIEITGIV